MPQASIFDSISTGDIDILGGGIGNQGVSGDELAKIFGAQAQAEVIQAAQEREDRKQRMKLIAVSTSIVASLVLIVSIYYFTSKPS